MKKVIKIRPRHIQAIKNLGKSRTEAEGLEKLNYSKSYAKSGQIKSTKSWKAVSEEMLPNDLLADVVLWLIAFKKYGFKGWPAVSSGLDKAFKAKKIYTNGVEVTNKYSSLSREELEARAAGIIAGIIGNRRGTGQKK